jgi:hypothetical protein
MESNRENPGRSRPRERDGKSAEGIVDGLSGEASEALQYGNMERTDRLNRQAAIEGLNGERCRMVRGVYGKEGVMGV